MLHSCCRQVPQRLKTGHYGGWNSIAPKWCSYSPAPALTKSIICACIHHVLPPPPNILWPSQWPFLLISLNAPLTWFIMILLISMSRTPSSLKNQNICILYHHKKNDSFFVKIVTFKYTWTINYGNLQGTNSKNLMNERWQNCKILNQIKVDYLMIC